MKKIYILKLFVTLTVLIIITISCDDSVELPKPDFIANQYSSLNKEITIAFSDISGNQAEEWIWSFEGGTPSVSYERDPVVTYNSAGTFNVTLTVRNGNGSRQMTKFDYINIVDFYNPTWADIDITVNHEQKTIPIDDYVLFANIDNPIIAYYAETSGYATDIPVGLSIFWNEEVNLNTSVSWDFIISKNFVFINVQNDGPDDFNPLIVNHGDHEYEITDHITIEKDNLWKPTGYYDAWDFMKITAYFKNDQNTWVDWIEDEHFDLLWVDNQGLDIWYDGSKSNLNSEAKSKKLNRTHAKVIKQSGVKR